MQVFHKLEDVPPDLGPTVLSVVNFDGVHRAHVHVLNEIVRRARDQHAQSMAVTFAPHPMRILRPDAVLKLLTPLPEKLRLLEATGLEAVLLLPSPVIFLSCSRVNLARKFSRTVSTLVRSTKAITSASD